MTKSFFLFSVVCMFGILGCNQGPYPATGRHDFSPLTSADQFEVFSLDPKPDPPPPRDPPEKEGFFHGYPILGSVKVDGEADRKHLLDAVQDALNREITQPTNCFWPRHGMRVTLKGEQTDFVICFHCFYVQIYKGEERDFTGISRAPASKFNEFLKARGVPLAPDED